MKRFIQSLTNEFLNEARSSPRMFEDLASMEHYMAESYDGRAFVEILQNADDATASSLAVFSCGTDFVIANNGKPFSQDDLISICRSGASSKRRGAGIGYRGIGFKSATSISTEIIIYSSGVYFTFSRSRCAREMDKSVDQVPTIRIPFLVKSQDINEELHQAISKYENEGFTTFFIFKEGNRDKFLAELKDLSSGWLLFLNCVECVSVDFAYVKKKILIKRKPLRNNQYLFTDEENDKSWLIVRGENKTAIAFKYDKQIIPCDSDESLFYCYLPTLDSLGYSFKANADFSTDPSRKHIIINDDDTIRNIESIAQLVVKTLSDMLLKDQPQLISLIATRSGISEASTYLDRQVISLLKTHQWIPMQNGKKTSVAEHKILPSWFDSDSKNIVFKCVPALGNDEVSQEIMYATKELDELFMRCGCQMYGVNEFSIILKNIDAIMSLKNTFLGKLWGYTLRSVFYSPSSIGSFFLKDKAGRIITFSDAKEPVVFSEEFLSGLKGVLSREELVKICALPAFKDIANNSPSFEKIKKPEKRPEIHDKVDYSNWKTPIQNCMVAEQLQGHKPIDVSKKALGYDIESADGNGCIRYFAVKPVEKLGDSFALNEKEYSCAERHGAKYGIYLIEKRNPESNMLIDNAGSISFEKRVREWEWICDKYEVFLKAQPNEPLAIDSKFLKEFSLNYLNRIQIAFLKAVCTEENIAAFEDEHSCKASSLATQINGIVDFYLGDTLIEEDLTIKGKYLGSVKQLLSNSNQ